MFNKKVYCVTVTREQHDYIMSNGYSPSEVLRSSIDIMRGKPNPLVEKLVEGVIVRLKEAGKIA